jgi:hypothetical protein
MGPRRPGFPQDCTMEQIDQSAVSQHNDAFNGRQLDEARFGQSQSERDGQVANDHSSQTRCVVVDDQRSPCGQCAESTLEARH